MKIKKTYVRPLTQATALAVEDMILTKSDLGIHDEKSDQDILSRQKDGWSANSWASADDE